MVGVQVEASGRLGFVSSPLITHFKREKMGLIPAVQPLMTRAYLLAGGQGDLRPILREVMALVLARQKLTGINLFSLWAQLSPKRCHWTPSPHEVVAGLGPPLTYGAS